MKYNTTYSPQTSLKETLEAYNLVESFLIRKIRTKWDLLKIKMPVFTNENTDYLLNIDEVSRSINFDFGDEYKVAQLFLSHSNWTRNMVDRLKLKEGEGLYGQSTTIWRDLPETPQNLVVDDHLIVQLVLPKQIPEDYFTNLCFEIYQWILEIEKIIFKKYFVNYDLPSSISFFSSQILNNLMPNFSFRDREKQIMEEKKVFVLEASGSILLNGKIHSNIPPMIYDLKNHFVFVFRDTVNFEVIKPITIAKLASDLTLTDQLRMMGKSEYLQKEFYGKFSKVDCSIIEIKINLPQIVMILLKKGHLGEVMPGAISNEAKIVAEKYKVEII